MSCKETTVLIYSESEDALTELLTAAREVGGEAARIVAAVVGGQPLTLARTIAGYAPHEVFAISTGDHRVDAHAISRALQPVVDASRPSVVLIGATRLGGEVAAMLAQRMGIACASECMSLGFSDDGRLVVERRVFGGRFIARQAFRASPAVVTVQLKRFARAEHAEGQEAPIKEIQPELLPSVLKTVNVTERSRSDVDITKAEIIVAAGRGIRKEEDLRILEQLARTLGGVVAGSRPLTGDVDWLPVDRRIGLSGQTVKPNLYIACGISGQIEHIVGMKGARTVVVINNDPKAPIHQEADYSIVGDLYEVVPALTDACANVAGERG